MRARRRCEPESTTTICVSGGRCSRSEGSSRRSSGAESCSTVTIVKLTRAACGRAAGAARRPLAPRCTERRARARRRPGGRAGRRRRRCAAARRRARSTSPTGTRSAASPSVSAKHARSETTAGVPWAAASSATSPKPSRYDGRHDGQRAGVERGQLGVVDAAQAVADDDEVGVEAAGACARVSGAGDVERLARIARADEEQVAAGAAGRERSRRAARRRPRATPPSRARPTPLPARPRPRASPPSRPQRRARAPAAAPGDARRARRR